MADKLTQHILDALGKAAAHPVGLPLFASKGREGLFPSTAIAKSASQKCLADGLLDVARTESGGRTARELYVLSEEGWEFLHGAVNPKQVLEDFVRVLEARQEEVGELLARAEEMAEVLGGIRQAVERVLPRVSEGRVPVPESAKLADAILRQLAHHASTAGNDCPLPDVYRSLAAALPSVTVGEFHDALRELHAAGTIYLHPWTGPLHEMPEPTHALLIGHNIAYYASLRDPGVRTQESGVRGQRAGHHAESDPAVLQIPSVLSKCGGNP